MGLFFVLSFSAAIFLLTIQRAQCAHIVGGTEVAPHSRPYMAALSGGPTGFFCGGTLIDENWVLTAAHCIRTKGTQVVLGAHERKNERETGRQYIQIAKWIRHSGYRKKTSEHDIMLLKLKKKAKIDDYVKILPIPHTFEDVQPKTSCQVIGWGHTDNNKGPSATLLEANIKVMNRSTCNDENHWAYQVIKKNMLCASDEREKMGVCSGDSGGPLICEGKQQGIASFVAKNKCGDPKYPGGYTHLNEEHLSWIKRVMNRKY